MTTASPIDPNRLLLTGENPYIRLSDADDGPVTSDASFWRILFSPGGPGHVLFLQSELTGDEPSHLHRQHPDDPLAARGNPGKNQRYFRQPGNSRHGSQLP